LATVSASVALTAAAHADSGVLWQADVYYPIGSIVSYQGHRYEALMSQVDFEGSGLNPSVSSLWKDVGAPSGERWFNLRRATWFSRVTNIESHCAPEWSASNIYTAGGVASVNGLNYRANWWTRGEPPATHVGVGGSQPWTRVGSCAADSKAAVGSEDTRPTNTPASHSTASGQAEVPKG